MINDESITFDKSKTKQFLHLQQSIFFSKADLFPKKNTLVLSDAVLLTYAKKVYLQYGKKNPRILSVVPITSFRNVFLVGNANRLFIIRFNPFPKLYTDYRMVTAHRLHTLLTARNIPTEKDVVIDISRTIVATDYTMTEYVTGQTLFDISLRKEIPKNLFWEAGKMLAAVHTIKTRDFGSFIPENSSPKLCGSVTQWETVMHRNLESHAKKCMAEGIINKEEHRTIISVLGKYSYLLKEIKPVLLHGDVANHNLIKRGRQLVFIDWEDALSGDYIYDLAFFGTGCYENNTWFNAFMQGYEPKPDPLHSFWQRYWYYYTRIALAKTVVTIRFKKNRKILRARILHAINMFTAVV